MVLRAVSHYGWAGVDLFFVLSGYLIAGQFFAAMLKGRAISIKSFYYRRSIRILPNYFVVLGCCMIICVAHGLPVPHPWAYLTFTQNFGIPTIFMTSWSLCVEQHFYLLFPLVIWLVARSPIRNTGALLFCLTVLVGIALRYSLWSSLRPDLVRPPELAWAVYYRNINFPTYTRLDGIACGVALAALEHFRPRAWGHVTACGDWLLIPAAGLLAVTAIASRTQMGFFYSVLSFPTFGLAFGLMVAAAVAPNGLLGRIRLPGVETLAVWSYAIYLTHVFALSATLELCERTGLAKYGVSMACAATLLIGLFGAALYYGVERFFLRIRDRKGGSFVATPEAVG